MNLLTIELNPDWWEFCDIYSYNNMIDRWRISFGDTTILIKDPCDLKEIPIRPNDILYIDIDVNSPIMGYLMLESRGLKLLKHPRDGRLRITGDDAIFIFNNLDLFEII